VNPSCVYQGFVKGNPQFQSVEWALRVFLKKEPKNVFLGYSKFLRRISEVYIFGIAVTNDSSIRAVPINAK